MMNSDKRSGSDPRPRRIIKKNDPSNNSGRKSREDNSDGEIRRLTPRGRGRENPPASPSSFRKSPDKAGRGRDFKADKSPAKFAGRERKSGYSDNNDRKYPERRDTSARENSSFSPRTRSTSFRSGPDNDDRGRDSNAGRSPVKFASRERKSDYSDNSDRKSPERRDASSFSQNSGRKSFRRDNDSDKSKSRTRFSRPKKSPYSGKPSSKDGVLRLNQFIAHSGICSRRQADDYIKAGLVTINGEVVSEMGIKIKPGDVVKYNGESIRTERKVYILLNKPKDYVTSLDDEQGRRTVIDLISKACPERVYPVGRLDRNTTGVMLLTNDGDLTGKLTHPKYNKKKIYHVYLDKNLKREDMISMSDGVELEDGNFTPDSISYIDAAKKSEVGVEIHSGRNRIVRRLFEYFDYKVIKLDRVYFAGLTKKNLARGKWRFLSEKEITMLKMNAYE